MRCPQLPIRPHYVNFRRGVNPRHCWPKRTSARRARKRPTETLETVRIGPLRWGSGRESGRFFRLRWDDSDTQADVVQHRDRRSGAVTTLRKATAAGQFRQLPHRSQASQHPVEVVRAKSLATRFNHWRPGTSARHANTPRRAMPTLWNCSSLLCTKTVVSAIRAARTALSRLRSKRRAWTCSGIPCPPSLHPLLNTSLTGL